MTSSLKVDDVSLEVTVKVGTDRGVDVLTEGVGVEVMSSGNGRLGIGEGDAVAEVVD